MIKSTLEIADNLYQNLINRGDKPVISLESLPALNKMLWGLKIGLTVLGARSSQGKSSFIIQVANDLIKQGKNVWIISLEMDEEEILERMFCLEQEVDNYEILSGKFKTDKDLQEKFQSFYQSCKKYFNKLLITYGLGKNFSEILSIIKETDFKPDVVILDYIQAIKASGAHEREMVNEYIRNFRELSKRLKFAGIICSQINREAMNSKDKTPYMHQLKSTGVLEEHADTVMLLHWPFKYDESLYMKDYQIHVAKQRNGFTGCHSLIFEPEHYKFSEISDKFIAERKRYEATEEIDF